MVPDHLTARSFAKINLALQVLGRRPDDYHELRTIFQTVSLYDTLQLTRSARGVLRVTCRPAVLPDSPDNLIHRAALRLREAFEPRYGAVISLRKRIPLGAGLGGGSSNAAVTLLALNRLWGLNRPVDVLQDLARTLGADVPFFLWGGTALGLGRGDEVYPCPPVAPFYAVLIYPGVSVSTRAAYAGLGRGPFVEAESDRTRLSALCYQWWDDRGRLTGLFNDFEPSVLPYYPEIARAHRFLARQHAEAVLLSGSGSTVFGLYDDRRRAARAHTAAQDRDWTSFLVRSVSRPHYRKAITEFPSVI